MILVRVRVCNGCLVAERVLLFCNPMDLPGFSVHGTSQARILEWVTVSFSSRYSLLRGLTRTSCIAGRFFPTEAPGTCLHGCSRTSMYLCMQYVGVFVLKSQLIIENLLHLVAFFAYILFYFSYVYIRELFTSDFGVLLFDQDFM